MPLRVCFLGTESLNIGYLDPLVPNAIKGMFLGHRVPKYWVLGPSGLWMKLQLLAQFRQCLEVIASALGLLKLASLEGSLRCLGQEARRSLCLLSAWCLGFRGDEMSSLLSLLRATAFKVEIVLRIHGTS